MNVRNSGVDLIMEVMEDFVKIMFIVWRYEGLIELSG